MRKRFLPRLGDRHAKGAAATPPAESAPPAEPGQPRASAQAPGAPSPSAPSPSAPSPTAQAPAAQGPAAQPPDGRPATVAYRSPHARPRGRDRHARGMRGPLAPPDSPLARTRADRFGDLVLDAVERLESRWERELATVEFAVEPVPPPPEPADAALGREVLLARLHPGGAGRPARIVLYRRPVEARAATRADLAVLVHDLVVEQVADLLGLEPETVDPDYGSTDY